MYEFARFQELAAAILPNTNGGRRAPKFFGGGDLHRSTKSDQMWHGNTVIGLWNRHVLGIVIVIKSITLKLCLLTLTVKTVTSVDALMYSSVFNWRRNDMAKVHRC